MTDTIKTLRPNGEAGADIPINRLGLAAGVVVETIGATAITLSDSYHGKILDFTNSGSVTVTVPAGLRADFCCGISQGGAGTVTLAESGTTINEPDDQLSTAAQYVLLTLCGGFGTNSYRLYGRTA